MVGIVPFFRSLVLHSLLWVGRLSSIKSDSSFENLMKPLEYMYTNAAALIFALQYLLMLCYN